MAIDMLTTSGITSLINSYSISEQQKRISPLASRKSGYENKVSGYSVLTTRLNSLFDVLEDMKETGEDSVFRTKKTSSTDDTYLTATAGDTAINGNYQIKVSQLAKNDTLISKEYASGDAFSLTGTHSFTIKTGDGEGGEYLSKIAVEFDADETHETAFEKIVNAINSDKAEVETTSKVATDTFTGTGKFTINLNGTEEEIEYDYAGLTYDEIMDDLADKVSSITGLTAEKVTDGSNVSLKILVDDSSNYITIDQTSDTGGLLGAAALNLNVDKEKGAAGIVSASSFAALENEAQVSLTSKNTGLDNRITFLGDDTGSSVLDYLGINLGASRPDYVQSDTQDTAGFIYSDIASTTTKLNSKIMFNGISIQRNGNVVKDLVKDVTFNLHSVTPDDANSVDIAVENDTKDVKGKIDKFIENFNSVYTYLKNNSGAASGNKGIFFSDQTASSLLSAFKFTSYSSVEGISTEEIDKLSEIGINFDIHTGLSVKDSSLLEEKLTEDISGVEKLFTSENGIANTLYNKIDPYLGSGGYLESSKSIFNKNVKNLSDKISSTQDSIDKGAEVLRAKYQQLQMQLATFLTAQDMFSQYSMSNETYY